MRRGPSRCWNRGRCWPVSHRAGRFVGAATDPAAVVCRRVESQQQIGTADWLHVLRDGPTWAPWRTSLPRLATMGKTRNQMSGR